MGFGCLLGLRLDTIMSFDLSFRFSGRDEIDTRFSNLSHSYDMKLHVGASRKGETADDYSARGAISDANVAPDSQRQRSSSRI